MLQRLIIALTQVKVGNIYENTLDKIRQISFFLHQPNEIVKILC